jgi:NO-binding membrane sensor protein with MHYT domain/GGDEF domain-containing protein
MQGSYQIELVLVSVLIAALASYVAIEFAGRIDGPVGRRRGWLAGGAIAMGSGIWSMHFVGMAAFELPIALSFDLGITALSWLAAVAVSALALTLVTGSGLDGRRISLGAVAMGAGICLMHYGGMWAMRMQPGITYDPLWFAISVLIAVGASAAALWVVARLRRVASWRDIALRLGAAGVMGLAVAGMHYSGMAAAQFAPGAFCASGNALSAGFMTAPVVGLSLLGLALAIGFALADARAVVASARAQREEDVRLSTLAFVDAATGLPNRVRLGQWLAERLAAERGFALIGLAFGDGPNAASELQRLARLLPAQLGHEAEVARGGAEQLSLLVDTDRPELVGRWCEERLEPLLAPARARGVEPLWGLAIAPLDGSNAQLLMLRAGARASRLEHLLRAYPDADATSAVA